MRILRLFEESLIMSDYGQDSFNITAISFCFRMFKFQLFTLLAVVSTTYAYSGGAPESACDDMIPRHPADPQSSEFPYELQLSKKSISPSDTVVITIGKDKIFKGFLLEVRKGNKSVGQFVISDDDKFSKTLGCHGGKAVSTI